MKLHLGCNKKLLHGFTNVDIRPEVKPDVVDDIFKLTKFEANSVNLIYTCHTLEHGSRQDVQNALRRWYTLLKPAGMLYISVPDFEMLARHYMLYQDLDYIKNMLNGAQKHPHDYHLSAFDYTTLKKYLESAGFIRVQRYDHRKTEWAHVDDYSGAYYPERHIPEITTPKPVLLSLNVSAYKTEDAIQYPILGSGPGPITFNLQPNMQGVFTSATTN